MMKLNRLVGIMLMLFALLPAKAAEQSTIVTPTTGPMSMATFAGTYLNPALRAIQACNWGTSAPANGPGGVPIAYQEWCDTTSNPVLVKRYNGSQWVTIGSLNTSSHVWLPYLTGGVSGGVPYFSATNIMGTSAALAANAPVIGGGAGIAPSTITAGTNDQILFGVSSSSPLFRTVTGDVTFSAGASAIGSGKIVTAMILDGNVTNAKLANAAAYTLKGNATGSSAVPTDVDIATLTTKASPASSDYIMLSDQAASGALKKATVSSISAAGSVSSIAGNTGAFTLSTGITNSTNDIRLDKATAANLEAGTSNKALTADIIYDAEVTITYAASQTFDFNTFLNGRVTLTGNITTLTCSNIKASQSGVITIVQDATGNRLMSDTNWCSEFRWLGGSRGVLSTTANAVDALFYQCVSTSICYVSLAKGQAN